MANWTSPRDWVDGETPTGDMFNTYIRDEFAYLKDSPTFDGNITASGDVTVGDDLTVTGDAAITSTLTVTGATALNGNVGLGDASADTVTITGTVVGAPLKTYTETKTAPTISASALTLDCSLGTYFAVALNSNCTITISNAPASGRALGITVVFTADGSLRTITWPGSVVWAGGSAPTMTSTNNKRDIITLITYDAGTTWFGVIVGQSF